MGDRFLMSSVFILGAGASQPYGFPVGTELVDRIIAAARHPNRDFFKVLVACDFPDYEIKELGEQLERSRQDSIDEFLEQHPDLLSVGKAAIAAVLIPHEVEHQLIRSDRKVDWYRHFLNEIGSSPEKFKNTQTCFITYNYDRSLEQYLHTAIMARWEWGSGQAYEAMEAIRIIHLHGQLGRLPFQSGKGRMRPYSPSVTPENVRQAGHEIITLHEANTEGSDLIEARSRLAKAEAIYFMGFGFHAANLRHLRIEDIKTLQRIRGTAHGFTAAERGRIKSRLKPGAEVYDETCLSFLRNHWNA
ncbi:MAG: hypothetical protein O7H41_12130 [Planctomycetota bacterium]|nr:hypothetical protein [Planctomycetota bacterium]